MNFQADEGVENPNCAEERRRRQLAKREWEKGGERKRHVAHAQDLDLGWDRKLLHPAAVRNTVTTWDWLVRGVEYAKWQTVTNCLERIP